MALVPISSVLLKGLKIIRELEKNELWFFWAISTALLIAPSILMLKKWIRFCDISDCRLDHVTSSGIPFWRVKASTEASSSFDLIVFIRWTAWLICLLTVLSISIRASSSRKSEASESDHISPRSLKFSSTISFYIFSRFENFQFVTRTHCFLIISSYHFLTILVSAIIKKSLMLCLNTYTCCFSAGRSSTIHLVSSSNFSKKFYCTCCTTSSIAFFYLR